MTIKSDHTSDLLDGDHGQASLSALGLDTEIGLQSEVDDLLSEWRSGEDEGSSSFNPYNALIEPRMQASVSDKSVTLNRGWEYDSVSVKCVIGTQSQTSPVRPLALPDIGDDIAGFRLLKELGSGSFAKVYLAKQGDLADREVVLKISAIEGTEPQTMAQLQHTHVVPIYSVHEDAQLGVRAVCMPYFGGASLNKVIKKVWTDSAVPATGKSLIEALDRVAGPKPAVRSAHRSTEVEHQTIEADQVETAQTTRMILAGLPYVQAVAWIIARLAEGLQHSHERNVIHRDIKPSNILLNSEGQPLLLDFNVSQSIDFSPAEATIGGTIAYMSPEHLRAMRERTPASNMLVNRRSDVYSLGLVLYEMLAGVSPFVDPSQASLNLRGLDARIKQRELPVPSLKGRSCLEIPWSLESIVRKSLAPRPADRYASASQLAEDLNRFLQDLPLKFAPELSRVEQIRKWGRRHPRLTTASSVIFMAAMLIIPGAVALYLTRDNLAATVAALNQNAADERARSFYIKAQEALCMVKTGMSDEDIAANDVPLRKGIAEVKRTLSLYRVTRDVDWQEDMNWQLLKRRDRVDVGETMRELLLELASAQVRLESKDPLAAGMVALSLLETGTQIRGLQPSRALELDRARYLSLLKRDAEAQQALDAAGKIPVVTSHDHYMLAAAHCRNRSVASYREAVRLLKKAIEMSPKHYWSHFQLALCHDELGESMLAVSDLGTCIGLWPQSSWAHFNRAYLLNKHGNKRDAIHDYTTAIRHDPHLQSAYFNRALAHLELREFEAALLDFKKVQELGRHDSVVDAARAMALEGMGQHAEADLLFAEVLKVTKKSPDRVTQRFSWTYAFSVAHRAPKISERVFDGILSTDPEHAQALYGKGMLAMKRKDLQQAVSYFDKALNAETTFIEPLRYRAVALARLGKFQQAWADAKSCIEREPTNPDSRYVGACVAALIARKLSDPEYQDQALELLQEAINLGADRERAREDPDFSALRGDPDFEKLLGPESEPTESIQADSN
ncbi:MAG: serine/threonine protein kinase [Planctomycetaceae bacterium]|nr:serine/threonine protein kinase [Planctomycetaceae bacterium]